MIIKKFYGVHPNGENLIKTYSDQNLYIKKVGTNQIYSEAIDVESNDCDYSETEEPIVEN